MIRSETRMTVHLEPLEGKVGISIISSEESIRLSMKWCRFEKDKKQVMGFKCSFNDTPVEITDLAAEHFIKLIIQAIAHKLDIGREDIDIINDRGETAQRVYFFPPTLEMDLYSINDYIARQLSLEAALQLYENEGSCIGPDILDFCRSENIMKDFFSIVNLQTSNFQINFSKE